MADARFVDAANKWNSGTVKTNTTTADFRLNFGTVANRAVTATYNSTMGTIIIDNTGVSARPFVIGSGNSTTGAVTIASGTLVILNGTSAEGKLVGSAGPGTWWRATGLGRAH